MYVALPIPSRFRESLIQRRGREGGTGDGKFRNDQAQIEMDPLTGEKPQIIDVLGFPSQQKRPHLLSHQMLAGQDSDDEGASIIAWGSDHLARGIHLFSAQADITLITSTPIAQLKSRLSEQRPPW